MRIYFDHNATTPVAPPVAEAMTQALLEDFGNASSVHHFGQRAKARLDEARSDIGRLLHAEPSEIVFTSGGTEADNLALRGVAEALEPTGRRHLIASAIEHEAVLVHAQGTRPPRLENDSPACRRDRNRPSRGARGEPDRPDRHRVASCTPITRSAPFSRSPELARLAHARGALFHTDAVQSVGEDSGRRSGARRRSAVAVGPQVQWSEGCRRAVDQARHAPDGAHDRRQARAEPAGGHGKRSGPCRVLAWRRAWRLRSSQPTPAASAR